MMKTISYLAMAAVLFGLLSALPLRLEGDEPRRPAGERRGQRQNGRAERQPRDRSSREPRPQNGLDRSRDTGVRRQPERQPQRRDESDPRLSSARRLREYVSREARDQRRQEEHERSVRQRQDRQRQERERREREARAREDRFREIDGRNSAWRELRDFVEHRPKPEVRPPHPPHPPGPPRPPHPPGPPHPPRPHYRWWWGWRFSGTSFYGNTYVYVYENDAGTPYYLPLAPASEDACMFDVLPANLVHAEAGMAPEGNGGTIDSFLGFALGMEYPAADGMAAVIVEAAIPDLTPAAAAQLWLAPETHRIYRIAAAIDSCSREEFLTLAGATAAGLGLQGVVSCDRPANRHSVRMRSWAREVIFHFHSDAHDAEYGRLTIQCVDRLLEAEARTRMTPAQLQMLTEMESLL